MKNPWGEVTGIRPVKIARTMFDAGKTEDDFCNKFINEMKVSEEKTQLTLNIAVREINILKNFGKNDICLYIGVPFCKRDVFTVLLSLILQIETANICVHS